MKLLSHTEPHDGGQSSEVMTRTQWSQSDLTSGIHDRNVTKLGDAGLTKRLNNAADRRHVLC